MSFLVIFDPVKSVVEAKIIGELRAEITRDAALEGIRIARENNGYKFLVDYRQAVVMDSPIDTYEFMNALEALGFKRTDRIALVYVGDMAQHRFAETVARNRGWPGIAYFSDMEAARKWLDV